MECHCQISLLGTLLDGVSAGGFVYLEAKYEDIGNIQTKDYSASAFWRL